MKIGEIIDYIEHRKIVCAVILKIDNKKLKVLVENGREIKLSTDRIFHQKRKKQLNLSVSKTQLIELLKIVSYKRTKIAKTINVKMLWNKIGKEPKWFEVKYMANLYFSHIHSEDEEAAIIRALFNNKLYFKFKPFLFYPNSKRKIDKLTNKLKQIEYYEKLINIGQEWIQTITESNIVHSNKNYLELKTILCSFYIFGKSSPYSNIANKILSPTKINSKDDLFRFIVKIGVWNINENIDIIRFKIPTKFSPEVVKQTNDIISVNPSYEINGGRRVDLTNKFTVTIDGLNTSDFDDAISIEKKNNNYLVGIHISDVAHYIKKGDSIDKSAQNRISSIYLPDAKIPMIPPELSENTFSLKKNKPRLAISTIIQINTNGLVVDYKIHPSVIRVDEQLNYNNADTFSQNCHKIEVLYSIAKNLRKLRIQNGATHIILPELNVTVKKSGSSIIKPMVKKIDVESPSRIIVSEMMILSNWITAQFLEKHKLPTIFRSQPEPTSHIIKNKSKSVFHNWMQRKMLRRLSLTNHAQRHCILGLNAYTTATSPIRKYSDLVTQRQIRSAISLGQGYTNNEISMIIKNLIQNTSNISNIQFSRTKYWLLKYLEGKIGCKEKAIILEKQKYSSSYNVLIKNYMLECTLPQSSGIELKPKDLVVVTIQHVNARNGIISIFMN